MKKHFIAATLMILFATGCWYGSNSLFSNEDSSGLKIANVEALTRDENSPPIPCYSSAKRNVNAAYVDCSKCERIEYWEGAGNEAACIP